MLPLLNHRKESKFGRGKLPVVRVYSSHSAEIALKVSKKGELLFMYKGLVLKKWPHLWNCADNYNDRIKELLQEKAGMKQPKAKEVTEGKSYDRFNFF